MIAAIGAANGAGHLGLSFEYREVAGERVIAGQIAVIKYPNVLVARTVQRMIDGRIFAGIGLREIDNMVGVGLQNRFGVVAATIVDDE